MARIAEYEHYDGLSGHLIVTMPLEAAWDCSTPGQDAGSSIEHWVSRVKWYADEDELRRIVRESGGRQWDDTSTADEDTLKRRVLWIAACDWRESDPLRRRTYGI